MTLGELYDIADGEVVRVIDVNTYDKNRPNDGVLFAGVIDVIDYVADGVLSDFEITRIEKGADVDEDLIVAVDGVTREVYESLISAAKGEDEDNKEWAPEAFANFEIEDLDDIDWDD